LLRFIYNKIERIVNACFDNVLSHQPEAVISVRGKERFVVMKIEQYHYLREIELEAALVEVRQDVLAGRTKISTIDEHVAEMFDQ